MQLTALHFYFVGLGFRASQRLMSPTAEIIMQLFIFIWGIGAQCIAEEDTVGCSLQLFIFKGEEEGVRSFVHYRY
jgi:hypothetical protein